MLHRTPHYTNTYYSASFTGLDQQLQQSYTHPLGPGELPTTRKNKPIYGILVPHSPYEESGPCSAWAYKDLAEHALPSTYIIMGSNHHQKTHDFTTSLFTNWETPLGIVNVNKQSGNLLLSRLPQLKNDFNSHEQEQSIEVQLPFLQFSSKDRITDLTFIPILINATDLVTCAQFARTLADIHQHQPFTLIATCQLTRYGPEHDYVPFITNKKTNIHKLDKEAITYIEHLDTTGLLQYLKQNNLMYCCLGPLLTIMEATKHMGAQHGRLLQYYTTGDITGDYTNSIGHAAIIFE